jgi:hypothetical protein
MIRRLILLQENAEMDEKPNPCEVCSTAGGCASRHTDEKAVEEASGAPFLLIAAIAIILFSLAFKWLF